jgi:propionyl-CoA carboxylase beta chain
VPKFTVITRKAYGGAYVVMCSKHIGADLNVAWPQAEIAVMGPDAAVGLLYRRELAAAENPDARRVELVQQYEELFASPYQAASRGYIDAVIEPHTTRKVLTQALDLARSKRVNRPARKHGNIPL